MPDVVDGAEVHRAFGVVDDLHLAGHAGVFVVVALWEPSPDLDLYSEPSVVVIALPDRDVPRRAAGWVAVLVDPAA
jgi:hypothetical protein